MFGKKRPRPNINVRTKNAAPESSPSTDIRQLVEVGRQLNEKDREVAVSAHEENMMDIVAANGGKPFENFEHTHAVHTRSVMEAVNKWFGQMGLSAPRSPIHSFVKAERYDDSSFFILRWMIADQPFIAKSSGYNVEVYIGDEIPYSSGKRIATKEQLGRQLAARIDEQ